MNVTTDMLGAAAEAAAFAVALGAIAWVHAQQRAAVARLDDRLAHLLAATSLLTDTAEGGLRDVAQEVGRLAGVQAATAPQPRRAATQRRVTAAARRGRSVNDIAAAEELSEGEVRLRLNMDRSQKERAHAAVR